MVAPRKGAMCPDFRAALAANRENTCGAVTGVEIRIRVGLGASSFIIPINLLCKGLEPSGAGRLPRASNQECPLSDARRM